MTGSDHPRARLDEVIVAEARLLVRDHGASVVELAAHHRVTRAAMSAAVHGRTWQHVPGAVPVASPSARARRGRATQLARAAGAR